MANPARSAAAMALALRDHARLLAVITKVEIAKKYAGSLLGMAWLVLQPTLLLGVYLFVYMVVFRLRFPGFSRLDYVLFVFAALVPYIGSIEAITASALSIKQNMHLVKNVMLPIELVPVRTVLVALAGEVVGLCLVVVLSALNGSIGPGLAALPAALALQAAALLGLAWIVASIAVALPDISYFISLSLFLLMFVSPIAFQPDMVPAELRFIVYVNPIYYLIEVFRDCFIAGRHLQVVVWAIDAAISIMLFTIGAAFFRAFKGVLTDYE
jgi:lipopolysaccharide transport system permease protein